MVAETRFKESTWEMKRKMCEIFGLPERVTWFELKCDFRDGSNPTILCEYFPSLELGTDGKIETAMKEFEIVEKKEGEPDGK